MGIHRRAAALAGALLVLAAGCTFPPMRTLTPSPSPSPSATASATAAPSAAPTLSPEPSPNAADIPRFGAGELIVTAIDGLRVRQRPGLTSQTVTGLLPSDSELQVVMGPIVVQELGWYLVMDADAGEPQFEEGWIAAGFEPEAFLRSTGASADGSPFLASFAQTGSAEHGPVQIDDDDYAIRWVAVDPERVRCGFAVSLAAGSGEPVPAIRDTVGDGINPGTLQPGSFAALGVRGPVFVSVESDCAWTLVILRAPDPAAEPSPSVTP